VSIKQVRLAKRQGFDREIKVVCVIEVIEGPKNLLFID
jgi:hypothetical protein|tara:strand:- start:3370 stop:3483 length:114 start_codon:yes stop_codon:yes gene_type:complete